MTTERTHTPGDWHVSELRTGETEAWSDAPAYERSIYAADGTKLAVCEQWIGQSEAAEAEANARLIALAPTAPHECAPDCPGEVNRRKLAAHDALVTALDGLLNELDSRAEKRSWDTHRAALALARGDAP